MAASSVWKRMLRLIDVVYGPNVITWGNVFWMDVFMWLSIIMKGKKYYLRFKLRQGKLRTYHIHAEIG